MIHFSTLIVTAALLASPVRAAEKYTQDQLDARFYYDLGPGEVDVSSYPKRQQANYEIFKKTCSQCHTLARPINSPIVSRSDWKRYVQRMHLHTEVRAGKHVEREEARAIIDFLAYDSQVRKVRHKAAFDAKTKELKSLFEDTQKERLRLQMEEDRKKANAMPLDSGSGAHPHP